MRKVMLYVMILLICLPAGTLFAGGAQETGKQEVTEISISSWRTEDVPIYDELIAMFEAENPDIKVTYKSYKTEEYQTVLAANFKGGIAADVIHLRAYGNFEQFAKPGYLLPLTPEIIPELSKYSDQSLAGSTSITDGNVYGVPYASQSLVIFYNKDVYAELGLTPPTTWAEFESNLKACKAAGITPIANGTKTGWMDEVLAGIISQNYYGGNDFYYDLVAGKTDFTDPRYVKSLDKLLDLGPYMPDGYVGLEYVESQMLFINDMAAHFLGGIWEDAYFSSQNPDLNYDIFLGPVENKGDTQYLSTFMDGSYGINKATPNKDEAIRFVNFLASAKAQQFLCDQLGVKTEHPDVVPTKTLLKKVMDPSLTTTPYMMLVSFRYEQPTGSALIQAGLQALFAGDKDAEEVCADIQKGVATYYKPFQ